MPPTKTTLLRALRRMAVLLELDGANTFRVGAFERAARSLSPEGIDVARRIQEKTLTELDGIGSGMAERITEFWDSGEIAELKELEGKFPPGVVEMTEIPGFGAKKARAVYDELGIDTIDGLRTACEDGSLAKLKGFGKKTAENIIKGIEQRTKHSGRFRLDVATKAARPILEGLRNLDAVEQVEVGGSLRRSMETVKDLDFVCATKKPEAVMEFFVSLDDVERVTGKGTTKSSVVLDSGMAADLRCVTPGQFPFALQHFTGSREHNTAIRARAKDMGLKSNEYGLFKEGSEKSLKAKSEADIYKHLGLDYIPPELRESMGEIEAAERRALPDLVEEKDLRGLPHLHTHYSDGTPQVEEYAAWAAENGYEWMGIADHSQTAAYAGGLKPEDVHRQMEEIDGVNRKWKKKGIRLLKGIESDILAKGELDYAEDLLKELEFIVASVHSRFSLSEKEQTSRIIAAVENPYTSILGHMTGRLILSRDGYEVNREEVIKACAREGVIIEINANPMRLDMDWRLIRFALDQGALLSIGPDAHVIDGLGDTRYGLAMVRKGWVTKDRLVNCLSAEAFLKVAQQRR